MHRQIPLFTKEWERKCLVIFVSIQKGRESAQIYSSPFKRVIESVEIYSNLSFVYKTMFKNEKQIVSDHRLN